MNEVSPWPSLSRFTVHVSSLQTYICFKAHDDAVNGRGLPRRNGQTEDYARASEDQRGLLAVADSKKRLC